MHKITRIVAREILDSRGDPTVEAEVFTDTGAMGRASVPSGASTGTLEALEKRDNDPDRFHGKGVRSVIKSIETEIFQALVGMDVSRQAEIDQTMIDLDGTKNKSRLGGNALLGVSLAAAKAHAMEMDLPFYQSLAGEKPLSLPVPMINILNGGVHASQSMDIQEFMIVPVSSASISEALRVGAEIFHSLRSLLVLRGFRTTVGDEGGFAPRLESNDAALELLLEAIGRTPYEAGKDVYIAIDAASSELFHDGSYHFRSENRKYSGEELVSRFEKWANDYPILSIEDGLAEDDWANWKFMTEKLGDRLQLVGDDLFVTNPDIIRRGIREKVANAVLIKPNQIGTLTETLEAIRLAHENGYSCVISHRSGETEDICIADLAVATGTSQIKAGSLSRTDRVAKYNRLLRIEQRLGGQTKYWGTEAFKRFL